MKKVFYIIQFWKTYNICFGIRFGLFAAFFRKSQKFGLIWNKITNSINYQLFNVLSLHYLRRRKITNFITNHLNNLFLLIDNQINFGFFTDFRCVLKSLMQQTMVRQMHFLTSNLLLSGLQLKIPEREKKSILSIIIFSLGMECGKIKLEFLQVFNCSCCYSFISITKQTTWTGY